MITSETHFNNLLKYGKTCPKDSVYYEIGAGYDMAIPIYMSLKGFKKLICVDVRKLVFVSLLNSTLDRINFMSTENTKLSKLPEEILFTKKNFLKIFKERFNLSYIAPLDARYTKFDGNTVDYVVTNAVLEHVPANIIYDILKETFRIMKSGGIMSNIIDYRDHFAYFDNSINFYNYLSFSADQWNKMNPPIMYQNRLRHKDYLNIINDIGFKIVKDEPAFPDESLLKELKFMKLDTCFTEKYTIDEMKILGSQLVLRKP